MPEGERRRKDNKKKQILDMITWSLMIVLVVGRVLSGVHWLTDIIGAVLISAFLLSLLLTYLKKLKKS